MKDLQPFGTPQLVAMTLLAEGIPLALLVDLARPLGPDDDLATEPDPGSAR